MNSKLDLFSAFGIELEYMIINQQGLSVAPISDQLIYDVNGDYNDDVVNGPIAWSNELVLHVIELKNAFPAKSLKPLSQQFQQEVQRINQLLAKYHASLLPTGAHPWMNPDSDAALWPHGYNEVYEAYNKIFNCRGHGWSNLQSVHLNLPFADDDQFAKLHTAIRVILPLIPALTASSPIIDGKKTGLLDSRLEYYRLNQQKIPSVTGSVIPELVFSEQEYQDEILAKIYRDIAPYDPEKILQYEWLNSRGAIARFDRYAIEIRVMDTQECPMVDLAIISLVVATLKALVAENWASFKQQTQWSCPQLETIFLAGIKTGLSTLIEDESLAALFGLPKQKISLQQLWRSIFNHVKEQLTLQEKQIIDVILTQGCLAERILKSLNSDDNQQLPRVYRELADCLQTGRMFLPHEDSHHL